MKHEQLPHLISLLEDPDPFVRTSILSELESFDESLEDLIFRSGFILDELQNSLIQPLLLKRRKLILEKEWQLLHSVSEDIAELERGFALISEFQNGSNYPVKLAPLLDELAAEYSRKHGKPDVFDLASFLFTFKSLGKPTGDAFYSPTNSNLVSVIEKKYGLPISLCAVFILVGARLGLHIEGCNYPGHFLARVRINGKIILFDCYNAGIQITEEEFPQLEEALYPKGKNILDEAVSARVILRRVLFNLVNAYSHQNDKDTADFIFGLLEEY